ncbi:alpha/beta hydrolase [Candidatus Bipolaricaulota sp. J31]
MNPETFSLRAPDGLPLRGYLWRAPARGSGKLLLLVHGYGEHARRYAGFAGWLAAHGWHVAAFDLRGHGESGGRRGHVASFRRYLEDLTAFRDAIPREVSAPRIAILGHSLGGLIVVRYLQEGAPGIAGAVLSSPALSLAIEVPLWKRALAHAAAATVPWFSLPSGLDPALLSHDPEVVEAYRRDPLVHRVATARWFLETLAAQRAALARAGEVRVPLLVIVGGDDRLVSRSAIEEFARRCGAKERELRVYDGFYHEPLNEVGHERVWEEILEWLEAL